MKQQNKSICPHGKNLTKEFCLDCSKGKLPIKLVREGIYTICKVKGKKIKHSLDKKVFYPWDK